MFRALSLRAAFRTILTVVLAAGTGLIATAPTASAQQQVVVGQNVNMVGGPWSFDPSTGKIVGDPFLQRQNEPSLALSSRNPCHILAGANDYRAVDLPGLPSDTETGDAWLGLMKSIDCGHTWTSTLLPGYPQDKSVEGFASPLKGLKAGADATVRPGPAGMFYYSGIAFDRGAKNLGKVFVARFIDSNNKEQGDPFNYAGTALIDAGTAGQFLDKPWIAADIPRGTATCFVDGQTIPAGEVYITYTSFTGGTNNPRSKIMFAKSSDCGATWSNPAKLSERIALNQGTVMAINPVDGAIYIAWREFADPNLDPNSLSTVHGILFVRSTDGGKSFTKAAPIDSALYPFDQGSSPVSFRTNAYPTMAVDGGGRIYVAWAARGFAAANHDALLGDARIVMSTSDDGGATWSMPRAGVDNYLGPGHQIMPALTFAAGKLVIAYYDFREDLSGVYNRFVSEGEIPFGGRRHTIELRSAMADPASAPVFTDYTTVTSDGTAKGQSPSTRVTQYLFGSFGTTRPGLVQVQFNPPNLPIFAKGTTPFIGDYIDIAGQAFTVDANHQWQFNTAGDGARVPLFHVAWTDNRDVRKPPPGQTWADYTSPTLGPNGLVCVPGSNPGSRNQNVYTAPLMPGLLVTAPGNHKTLGTIQRAYVVYARNATSQDRYYRLTLDAPPAGAFASFTHIDESQLAGGPAVTTEIGPIFIPRRSSIARSVFIVAPGIAYPQVGVNVLESTPGEASLATASVVLNPDIANPDIANPDIANPDIANPDIANAEVYNPDIANPDIANPDIANPDIANPDIANPDIANPDIANPDIANPDIANPDIANPDIANPDIANPDIANPDIANASPGDYKVTDITWSVTNKGNTTAAYAFRAALKRNLPDGAKYQLIVRRVYIAPQANIENACAPLLPTIQSQVLVNIPNPDVTGSVTATFDPNKSADNASFFLLPADRGLVTLRVFCPADAAGCPTNNQAAALAAARVESQAPNDCRAEKVYDSNGNLLLPNCAVNSSNPDDIYNPTDTTPPAVALVGSPAMTIEAGAAFADPGATALDAVDGALSVVVTGTVRTDTVGSYTLTYAATDLSGNSASVTRTVTVKDTMAPVVNGFVFPAGFNPGTWYSAPSITATVDVAPGGSPVTIACTDSLGGTTISGLSITVSGDGSHVVACTVTDAGGNSTPAGTTVNLDSTAPVVAAPSVTLTAEAAGPSGASVVYGITTAADALSGATVVCSPPSGSTFPIGTTTVTCTATDGAGNSAAATFAITVADTAPPVIVLVGDPTMTVEAGSAFADPGATATDRVDGVVAVSVSGAVNAALPGSYTLTYTATDATGHSASSTRVVTVIDSTAPAVTVPANITAEATAAGGAAVSFSASAADLVDGTVAPVCTPASGSTFALGTTTVTCSAADAAGNTGTNSFTVTVSDKTAPTVTVPANITAEATAAGGAAVSFSASATDIVDGTVAPVCTPASGAAFALGTTTVNCSATDAAGNTGTNSFTVTVSDKTAPTVTVPANITAEATAAGGAAVSFSASASDLVSGAVVPVCTPASGAVFALGTTMVNCSATDAAGNKGTGSFSVTVRDTTAPALMLPANITGVPGGGPTGAVVTYSASAMDIVSGARTIACLPASGSAFAVGTTPVTCSASDAAGNTASGTFTVSVVDATKPTISLIGSATMSIEAGSAFADPGATATDFVDGTLPVTITGTVQTTVPGTYVLTYSARDRAGNTASVTRSVTVVDTKPPSVTVSVSPALIWSPNGAMVSVTVSGIVTDQGSGVAGVSYKVTDEYGLIQPTGTVTLGAGGAYSFPVSLQASRKGSDKNGRSYTITITATDKAGLKTSASTTTVAVEHNQ